MSAEINFDRLKILKTKIKDKVGYMFNINIVSNDERGCIVEFYNKNTGDSYCTNVPSFCYDSEWIAEVSAYFLVKCAIDYFLFYK